MIANLIRISPLVRLNLMSSAKQAPHLTNITAKRHRVQEFPETKYDNRVQDDYVLVLPEEVTDNPQTNEILRIPEAGEAEIDFSKISVEKAYKGLSQAICSFNNFIIDFDNGDVPHDKSMEEIIKGIEERLIPMDTAYNILVAFVCLKRDEFKHKQIFDILSWYKEVRGLKLKGNLRDYFSPIYNQKYYNLPSRDKCMVNLYRSVNPKSSPMTHIELDTHERHVEMLDKEIARFRENYAAATRLFSQTIDDPDLLSAMSPEYVGDQDPHHKERTPFKVTISTYHKFMRACPDRFIREALWSTKNKRCSPKALPTLNNTSTITSIRNIRKKVAQGLGYRSHTHRRIADTMVQSKQQIVDDLTSLNDQNMPKLRKRLFELNEFAANNNFEGGSEGLQDYDVDFWSHKYIHEVIIGRSEAELKSFFPLEKVQDGLKSFFQNYLGITIDEVPEHAGKLWHSDVKLQKVSRCGQSLGFIIFDPYHRSNKLFTNCAYGTIRSRDGKAECLPMLFLSASFNKEPRIGKPSLTPAEVMNLFCVYSTVIQRLLYNFGYYELNHEGAIEPDASSLFPNLCVSQILMDHRVLQSCSDRGKSKMIDSDLASKLTKSLSYFKAFDTWRELYLAHLDLEAHTVLSDLKTLAPEVYGYYSPFVRSPDNYDYCSMDEIFAGPKDGLQFTELLSKQLANICMSNILPKDGSQNLSTLDIGAIRQFNNELIDKLYNPNEFDMKVKVESLVGGGFELSKAGLGVL